VRGVVHRSPPADSVYGRVLSFPPRSRVRSRFSRRLFTQMRWLLQYCLLDHILDRVQCIFLDNGYLGYLVSLVKL
jgi:hypothetical protein